MEHNTPKCDISLNEIGTILTKLAVADEGFLTLLLVAASKTACTLPPEDYTKLAQWGKTIRILRGTDPETRNH